MSDLESDWRLRQPVSQRSLWRLFPHAVAAFIGAVMMVNFGMAWLAMRTFPGVATRDVFDHSNSYDRVLEAAAREAALGWSVQADLTDARPLVLLADRDGKPLAGARLEGAARRPLGADDARALAFRPVAPGRFVADQALTEPGQWELRLVARHNGQTLHATRRVVVR